MTIIMHALHILYAAIPTSRAYFGEGQGPIHVSKAQCSGTDVQLIECDADITGVNSCHHREDAGVICYGTNKKHLCMCLIVLVEHHSN